MSEGSSSTPRAPGSSRRGCKYRHHRRTSDRRRRYTISRAQAACTEASPAVTPVTDSLLAGSYNNWSVGELEVFALEASG